MAIYLSAQAIREAINRLGNSKAKNTLFDFLIVKRSLALANTKWLAISESQPVYVQALDELGRVSFQRNPVNPNHPYYNFFDMKPRSKKYKSNGTNTTIGNPPWRVIFDMDDSERPRKSSLAKNYLSSLADFFLTKANAPLPKLADVAIWYHRGQDITDIIGNEDNAADRLKLLSQRFAKDAKLTNDEVKRLFDSSIELDVNTYYFANEEPHPDDYLVNSTSEPTMVASVEEVEDVSADLVVALASKGFVILTGPSGTGKSRSALKLAEGFQTVYRNKTDASLFALIAVGPDWTSPKRLLGFRTPFGAERTGRDGQKTNESYEITDALRLMLRASHPELIDIPHFLVLDEMNLSQVERYFAPFLSLMEAASFLSSDNQIGLVDASDLQVIADILATTDPDSVEAESAKLLAVGRERLVMPRNLFVVGTVNVDETTYMFSPKVLDRAHVIELAARAPSMYMNTHQVAGLGSTITILEADGLIRNGLELRKQWDSLKNPTDVFDELSEKGFDELSIAQIKDTVVKAIDGCFALLSPVGFPFEYRTSNGVCQYIATWIELQRALGKTVEKIMESWSEALDRAILQRVLPKIHGNKRTLGESLRAVSLFLSGADQDSQPGAKYTLGVGRLIAIAPENKLALLGDGPQMPRCTAKLDAMHERLHTVGHVSFVC